MDGLDSGARNTTLGYLIQEGQAQEPEVLQALVLEYGGKVYALAAALFRAAGYDPGQALDRAGLAFFRAVRNTQAVHRYENLHTWLLAELLKMPVKRSRQAALSETGVLPDRVQALGENLRLPVLLRYNQGLSITEISQLLKTSDRQVLKRLLQAREALLETPGPQSHRLEEMHAILDGQESEQNPAFEDHLEKCETCTAAWGRLKRLHTDLDQTIRPGSLSLGAQESGRILEIARSGLSQTEKNAASGLPLREWVWMSAAVIGFLLVFQWLSPLWAAAPAVQARPTQAAASQLGVQFPQVSYENLISVLAESPAPSWERIARFTTAGIPTTGIEFSPDGRFAAYGKETLLFLLDLDSSIRTNLLSPDGVLTSLAFSGGERQLLASGNEHGSLWIWSLNDLARRYALDDFPGPVHSLAFSPGGEYLAAGGNRGIWIFQMGEDSLVRVMELPWDWIRSLAISPDGSYLAAADRDRSIAVWDMESFQLLGRFRTGQRYTTELAFSPDSRRLAVAGFDGTVLVIGLVRSSNERIEGTLVHTLEHPSWVSDVAWLGNGEYLATSAAVGEGQAVPPTARGVFTWEMSTGLPASLPLVNVDDYGTNRLGVTPEGRLLTATFNGNIFRWSDTSGSPSPLALYYFRRESNVLDNRVAGIPAGNILAISSPNRSDITDFSRPANPLLQEIPLEYRYYGSSYTSFGSEQYFYLLNRREEESVIVTLRIRPLQDMQGNPVINDFIGASALVTPIEVDGIVGELVQGEWVAAAIDPENVFRWSPTSRTRFRWAQNDLLIELATQSDEVDPVQVWQAVFQPIANAVILGERTRGAFRYIVTPGDTCSQIAVRYGTTVQEIEAINGPGTCNLITIGQELFVRLETAPKTISQSDLNCDGVPEIIRTIPAEESIFGEPLSFGMIVEALPTGMAQDSSNYTRVWEYSIVDHDVDYFTEPILFSPPGECQVLIALSGYGGNGREAGLSVFQWTGRHMQPILSSAGALNSDPRAWGSDGQLTLRTTRLTLNATMSSCVQTDVYYTWQNGRFNFISQKATGNIDCLGNAP